MSAPKWHWCVLIVGLVAGCQWAGYDRIPATAVDNPDPLLGSRLPRQDLSAAPPAKSEPAETASRSSDTRATPTAQPGKDPNRIGPLTFRPTSSAPPPKQPADAFSPGPATLTLGVKEPKPEPPVDQNIRPASTFAPASDPEVVKGYRKRLLALQATPPKTRRLENGVWEAVVYFEMNDSPGQLRRIEAEGVTEADALLAIVEKLERNK